MNRIARRAAAQKFKPNKSVENAYARALSNIAGQVHKEYVRRLNIRQDALTEHSATLDELGTIALSAMKKGVIRAFDTMAQSLKRHSKGQLKGITIPDTRLDTQIAAARDANIRLMENAQRSYAQQVRDILEDPAWHNKPVDQLADEIEKRGDVARSRAELIARDQTLKLNSQITKIRAQNAGLTQYVWNTSHDERVRPEHAELDGQTFSYATGAPSLDGLNPGEDFQCRCVALPVFDQASEESDGS